MNRLNQYGNFAAQFGVILADASNLLHERSRENIPYQGFTKTIDLTERCDCDYDADGNEVLPGSHDVGYGMEGK